MVSLVLELYSRAMCCFGAIHVWVDARLHNVEFIVINVAGIIHERHKRFIDLIRETLKFSTRVSD